MALAQGRWRLRAASQTASAVGVFAALSLGGGIASANHLDDFEVIEPSCRYLEVGAPGPAENKLEVSLGNYEDVEIERVDDRIRVNEVDESLHREVTCDFGRATVHNIDSISLVSAPSSSSPGEIYFDNELSIDLQAGLLEPGATPEADGSEIELAMGGDQEFIAGFTLITSDVEDQNPRHHDPERDRHQPQRRRGHAGRGHGAPAVLFGGLYAGGGNDVVIAQTKMKKARVSYPLGIGVLGEKGDDLIKANLAVGGEGEDNLVGGAKTDLLIGGEGNDAVRGKNSPDFLASGGGRDRLLAGGDGDIHPRRRMATATRSAAATVATAPSSTARTSAAAVSACAG